MCNFAPGCFFFQSFNYGRYTCYTAPLLTGSIWLIYPNYTYHIMKSFKYYKNLIMQDVNLKCTNCWIVKSRMWWAKNYFLLQRGILQSTLIILCCLINGDQCFNMTVWLLVSMVISSCSTVKPVLRDRPCCQRNMVFHDRRSLTREVKSLENRRPVSWKSGLSIEGGLSSERSLKTDFTVYCSSVFVSI